MFDVRFRFPFFAAVVIAAAGVLTSAAVEEDRFLTRSAEAEQLGANGASERALRQLDALIVEAINAGRHDAQVWAIQARARIQLRAGRVDAARDEIEDALTTARQFGLQHLEPSLTETFAAVWLAAGDLESAALWLERSYQVALAQTPPQTLLAREALVRLAEVQRSLGNEPLAAQAEAWLELLLGGAGPGVDLQPLRAQIQVASDEIGRARLVLTNASTVPLTGTLVLDNSDVLIKEWKSRVSGDWVVLGFADPQATLPAALSQGRKVSLRPGEQRFVTVEMEPALPVRPAEKTISFTWQSGEFSSTSSLHFHFVNAGDLNDPSVANASHVRLSPYASIPVYEEIYYRGEAAPRIESFLPATSAPCRVEIYELGRVGGSEARTLLAVDADGDGEFTGPADEVIADYDHDGFPDVSFTAQKPVAAIELRLYPIADSASAGTSALDLTISLREGKAWRQPPDVRNRVERK
ncbi:MAG: tetratricopeptide repeat protein [Verrucomicrobiales bacterium]